MAAVASQWRDRQRRVLQSVFQTDIAQPSPHSTQGTLSGGVGHPDEHPFLQRAPPGPTLQAAGPATDDQAAYDRAWHVVTAHIALPSSATADDSFGSLAADSQHLQPEFLDAFGVLVNASSLLPGAARDDVLSWHVRQVRAHYTQHVIPLLAGCVDENDDGSGDEEHGDSYGRAARKGNYYERHMVIVMSSIRTLEAALRLYFYGLNQLLSGFARLAEVSPEVARDAETLNARFRRDLHALVSNSAPAGLMRSVKAVLVRLAGTILGMPSQGEPGSGGRRDRPVIPGPGDLKAQAARERLVELVQQLHNVGLASEPFQTLFAEVMDVMMSEFVTGAFAGLWSLPDSRPFSATKAAVSLSASLSVVSPSIASLSDWVENHFARLTFDVLACTSNNPQGPLPVSLADAKTYQSLALGRLAALRIQELFDIALAWPASRPALDDLRATITTPARRKQLTDSFSRALRRRLLHPGCSTSEILRTYISIIRTLHALDPSRVLLSNIERGLQMYLCQREDAIRVVVSGLLASPEEMQAARDAQETVGHGTSRQGKSRRKQRRDLDDPFTVAAPGPSGRMLRGTTPDAGFTQDQSTLRGMQPRRKDLPKLAELGLLLHDSAHKRAASPADDADADLDWDDMTWVPDPIDAGDGYRRPRSVDVIGTLIAALGSGDTFIKEFSVVVADRLLSHSGDNGEPAPGFDQELRVLALLKRRFGEASLQACDVMIRDVQDSRKVDGVIARGQARAREPEDGAGMEYHARILSRLFWPGLEREHFLLPAEVVEQQERYEAGYESLKSRRKLAWLNQLGRAQVELELRDRTLTVDCSTVEATVVYAFQQEHPGEAGDAPPVQKTVDELYEQLQMDEDLITAALQFWVGQGVLRRVGGPNATTYAVVESLADDTPATGPAAASSAEDQPMEEAADTPRPAVSAKERERRDMYWRYIRGMLTNARASMAPSQMVMMLTMLITDGFAWSHEELVDFLAEKVAAGEMEVVGGKYKLVKN